MRKIDRIVIHCSATRADQPLSAAELDRMHRKRGFNGCGYHYYIRRDGQICTMRPVERVGAHAKGYIITLQVSGSVMKGVWIRREWRLIPVPTFRSGPCAYWCGYSLRITRSAKS